MSPHQFLSLVVHINDLICTKSTGTPRQMALRLHLSERSWYYLLDQLRNHYRLPIAYSCFKKSYYYTDSNTSHWEDFLEKLKR